MNIDQNKSILKFTNPQLKETIFKINAEKHINNSISMNLLNRHSQIVSNGEYDKCEVELTLTNSKDDSENSDEPFILKVTMSANFEWPKDTDEELVNNFLKINAPSMLLAYIRPVVSQLTGLTKFGIQQIPFIDFTRGIDN